MENGLLKPLYKMQLFNILNLKLLEKSVEAFFFNFLQALFFYRNFRIWICFGTSYLSDQSQRIKC